MKLTPFYIGQKIVALSDGITRRKGNVYVITGMEVHCKCGLTLNLNNITGTYLSGNPKVKGTTCLCVICGSVYIDNGFASFSPKNFAPVQEQTFPLITLSKIQEKEKSKEFEPALYEPQLVGGN